MIPLVAALVAGSILVFLYRGELPEPRRAIMALATLAFFFAPPSEKPLRGGLWLAGAALVAWGAQVAASGRGGFLLWLACSVAGALVLVRGGSRAVDHYLPAAGSEPGRAQRRAIRIQLQIAVALFLLGYLVHRAWGAIPVALSAVFFLRYVLLQAKHLGIPAKPVRFEDRLVPSQRWVVLSIFALVGATPLPQALLRGRGEGGLLVTAALLSVAAALIFVLSLSRSGCPRAFVRRASFAAGLALAVAITAVLVELESWDRDRYRVFASASMVFLVVLPLVKGQTKLFDRSPRAAELVPSAALSVMMAPVTALSGSMWELATTVFLVTFALLALVHHLLAAVRERASGRIFLAASLGVTLLSFARGGGGRSWQVFFLSVGAALYAVDLFERVWRESRLRTGMPAR